MHKIGIDISRTVGEPTGVGWYTLQLVRALAEVDTENRYTLYPFFWYCHPDEYRESFKPKAANFKVHDLKRSFAELQKRWSDGGPSHRDLLGPIELLHSPAYTAPYVPGVKLVVTIHDMSFLTHPQFHTDANRRFCMVQTLRAARYADAIICVSQSTANDVRRYMHVPLDRLFVIPEAAGPEYKRITAREEVATTLMRLGIRENFLLFVGTVEPRKNLSFLLEAYAKVRSELGRPEWLIVAGGSGWKNKEIYGRVNELGLADSVVFLGYVSTEDLVVLYNSCRLFVYPSLYEGFGLPVLEAMACGAPVITSNISSLPEVVGDAALKIDPNRIDGLAEAIASVLTDESLRGELRRNGLQRANNYSWEETARQTVEVYKRCLE